MPLYQLSIGNVFTKTENSCEVNQMKARWSLGDRARVKKGHAWSGKSVVISSILPGGSVVRITDNDGNSTIISINYIAKPY